MHLRSLFLLAELLAFGVPAHSYAHARRYSKRTIEGLLLTGIPHDHRSYALRSADMQVRFKVCKANYPKKVSAVRPMRTVNVAAPAPEAAGGPNTASASTIVNKALGTSKTWTLVQAYSGNTFFNGWNFYTGVDPMNGTVQYLDKPTAALKNLTRFSNGQVILSVETAASIAGNRKSVRLESQLNFTGGLVVIDVAHVPQGCGTSSMLFSYGPEWPKSGEINVIQGFNDLSVNSPAIHTVSGCSLPTADISSLGVYKANLTGSMNCNTLVTGSNGCMLRDAQSGSSGAALNAAGGGVYTMIWVDQGIQVWFFPRKSIPADLAAGTPQPGSWNSSHLKGFWPAPSCNVRSLFKHHKLALYTTFCGYAAGGQWKASSALGQSSSCAARTGYTSCEDYVKKRGGDFANAYWSINYVRVYA